MAEPGVTLALMPQDWGQLASYAGLVALATFSIYTGSFGALPPPKRKSKDGTTEEHDDDEELPEQLSLQDAWLFPVIGSVVLFGLYLLVKYVGKEWINWFLQWYFTLVGVGSGGKALVAFVRWALGDPIWKQFDQVKFIVSKGSREVVRWSIRTPSLYLIPLGAVPSILYTFGGSETQRSAVLTDILALSFSYNGISVLTLDSFRTGCALLVGLLVYDIWWVFGTEVMVKVATTLDVPIKVVWAKSTTFSPSRGFTMLGLGDIVIPGMFVALALHYDYHKASDQAKATGKWSKPYFHVAMGAYVAGLVTTMTVMHVFHAAQPALLYLSPACILSFVLTATAKGELAEAWKWSAEDHSAQTKPSAVIHTKDEHAESNGTATTTALPSNGDTLVRKKED